ncbi:class II aldolase/adducin family protein [Aeromicrobium wangtongii]|uniref:class II aldolase/adducin family protein n=1 Tax=Aeromicrobium wangtongii TaxID=2969247 RepID=UPI002017485E|nr:class II aldolase/adducin family protein [Aeromicrobium wangtongii]MCL3817643.1 class II aldolase/adducin family protein [Aeromicrobium wangtongii]
MDFDRDSVSRPFAEERRLVAEACRVLAARGLADGFLGHLSLRVDDERLLVRCRGPQERGLAWTTADDVHLVDLDGMPAGDAELDGWTTPHELPLHTEVLRTRPDAVAVAHAHPPAVVAADLAGLRIRPIVGAFDIPGARLAAGGVPVYKRAVLIRNRALAAEMTAAMGERPVVLLRGHGLTSAGATVAEAVLNAISVDQIARLALTIASAGGVLSNLPAEDLAELPDLGGGLNHATAWRHEIARLPHTSDL